MKNIPVTTVVAKTTVAKPQTGERPTDLDVPSGLEAPTKSGNLPMDSLASLVGSALAVAERVGHSALVRKGYPEPMRIKANPTITISDIRRGH